MFRQLTQRIFQKDYCSRIIMTGLLWALLTSHLIQPTVSLAVYTQQTEPTMEITDVDLREFPLIKATVLPGLGNKSFASITNPNQVTILENDQEIIPQDLTQKYRGVHLAIAINPNIELDRRDVNGVSYFDQLIESIKQIKTPANQEGSDYYSLTINPDVRYQQLTDLASLFTVIDSYESDFRNQQASLDSFSVAIDTLSMDISGKDKVLIYITPLPLLRQMETIETLFDAAISQQIALHVWMVGPQDILDYEQTRRLTDLTAQTGGSFFSFSGTEIIPNPSDYLTGLGYNLELTYYSSIRKSGDQSLAVSLSDSETGMITSSEYLFELEVLPISVELLNLQENLQIQTGTDGSYTPEFITIEAAFTFPDGFPRSFSGAALYVNGNKILENTQPPYGSFQLDLGQFEQSEALTVQVKVIDELGLEGASTTKKISLEILAPPESMTQENRNLTWLIILVAIAFCAAAGALYFVKNKKSVPELPRLESNEDTTANLPTLTKSLASFIRLDKDNQPLPERPMQIYNKNTLIGSDSNLCQLVIADPALDPQHAQLIQDENDEFKLIDLNTTAGTWVNFEPIGIEGVSLVHGDLVHLGSQVYRFSSSLKVGSIKKVNADNEKGE